MITTSDTRLTVTSHPSREQPGPLSCHGVWKIICVNSNKNLLCKTHQLITTLQTGTSIAKLWLEWTASVADQRTGEQPAALTKCNKRLTSKITWEESSATGTSWRIMMTDNVCQWITWMFVDIQRVVPGQGSISDLYPVHIQSAYPGCAFHASSGGSSSEDDFGYYGTINKNFRCTMTDDSTTQWWFGGYMADWTIQLVVNYMLKMYMPFGSILDLNTGKGNIIFSLI